MIPAEFPIRNSRIIGNFFFHFVCIYGRITILENRLHNSHHARVLLAVLRAGSCAFIPKAGMNIPVAKKQQASYINSFVPIVDTCALYVRVHFTIMDILRFQEIISGRTIGIYPIVKKIYGCIWRIDAGNGVRLKV